MAGTVSQTQVSSFSTPTNGTTADADVVRGNDNTLRAKHNTHDADATIHVQSSVLASRPAAGTAGRFWVTTDSSVPRFWYDTGSTWAELDYLNQSQGGDVTAALTVSGGITGALPFNDAAAQVVGGATSFAVRDNGDARDNLLVADAGDVTAYRDVRAAGDSGAGAASTVSLTNFDDSGSVNASGTGTIKFKDTTSRNSTGFLKVYVGTMAVYVPYFSGGG